MDRFPDLPGDPGPLVLERPGFPATPTIRLLAAILEDACFCLQPTSLVSPSTRADTVAWVRGEVASAAFCSFSEVCDILGLDAQAVRARLLAPASTRGRLVGPAPAAAA